MFAAAFRKRLGHITSNAGSTSVAGLKSGLAVPGCYGERMARTLQRIPVDLIHVAVTRALDPRIHHVRKIYAKLRA